MKNSQLCFLIANLWFVAPALPKNGATYVIIGVIFLILSLIFSFKKV